MSRGEYADRQREENARYTQAYAEWVAKLSPKQRRHLREQGLLRPEVDSFQTGKQSDVSELPIPVYDPEPDAQMETPASHSEENDDAVWAALRRLIAELLCDPNPALAVECLAVASSVGYTGETMTAIAKRHKVTRAAVSKRCTNLTEQLNLLPSRAMRSLTARQSYRTTQNQNHEHRERFDNGRRTRPSD